MLWLIGVDLIRLQLYNIYNSMNAYMRVLEVLSIVRFESVLNASWLPLHLYIKFKQGSGLVEGMQINLFHYT